MSFKLIQPRQQTTWCWLHTHMVFTCVIFMQTMSTWTLTKGCIYSLRYILHLRTSCSTKFACLSVNFKKIFGRNSQASNAKWSHDKKDVTSRQGRTGECAMLMIAGLRISALSQSPTDFTHKSVAKPLPPPPPPPPTPCPPHLVLPGNPSSIPIPILGPLTPTPLRPYTILLDFSGSTLQCGPGFCNHTLGYGDRGPKSYPWLRKMGQNKTLDSRKCHQINHFWSNFARNWSNLAQILSFAYEKMVELGNNGQNLLKTYPWLQSLSQK